MGLLDQLKRQAKGVAAQVNMSDGGQTYGSATRQQPAGKMYEDRSLQALKAQNPGYTFYEDGSIQMGGVGVSPGYSNQQISSVGNRRSRSSLISGSRNAQGNDMAMQQTISPGLGSGTRIPDFTQPSRQRMYEDEYTGQQQLQPVDYNTQQGTASGSFNQGSFSDQDLLRYLTRR